MIVPQIGLRRIICPCGGIHYTIDEAIVCGNKRLTRKLKENNERGRTKK